MTYDPDLPRGFQDADFDMRELEAKAAEVAALRKRGICTHGWIQGPYMGSYHPNWEGPKEAKEGQFYCFHCKGLLDSDPFERGNR